MSSTQRNDARDKYMRSSGEYTFYNEYLGERRSILTDPNVPKEDLERLIDKLDHLYADYAQNSDNSSIIEEDRRALKETVQLIVSRMRNQTRSMPGEITVESFVANISSGTNAAEQATQSDLSTLEKMGIYAFRRGKLFLAPGVLPQLGEVNRKEINRGPRQQDAVGELKTAQGGVVQGTNYEEDQKIIQSNILQYLSISEKQPEVEYCPISLYELCFDPSYRRCIENFFFVSILIKEKHLWVGPDEKGLPVVGTMQNREEYLKRYPNDRSRAQIDHDDKDRPRSQFNWNLNYKLYQTLRDLYKDNEPIIQRPKRKRSEDPSAPQNEKDSNSDEEDTDGGFDSDEAEGHPCS